MKNLTKALSILGMSALSFLPMKKSFGQTELNYPNMDSLKYKCAEISKFLQESYKKDSIKISQLNLKTIDVKYSELEKINVILESKPRKNYLEK